jgi:hypothetical protein
MLLSIVHLSMFYLQNNPEMFFGNIKIQSSFGSTSLKTISMCDQLCKTKKILFEVCKTTWTYWWWLRLMSIGEACFTGHSAPQGFPAMFA